MKKKRGKYKHKKERKKENRKQLDCFSSLFAFFQSKDFGSKSLNLFNIKTKDNISRKPSS
jgi:hypothetical protein